MGANADGIESLIDAVIDGRCGEDEARRFEELVRDDPRAREEYLEQIRMHALLEWRHGLVGLHIDRDVPARGRWWFSGKVRWRLAALVLVGVGLLAWAARPEGRGHAREGIATLVEARDVIWGEGQAPIAVNERLHPREIRCASGVLKIAFDSGALVTLEGPADLEVLSGMRLRADRGRLTARIAEEAKGFSVETPNTLVVDQGAEFGVEVDDSGWTGVIAFEGLVDLARPPSGADSGPIKRLEQGEGLRIGRAGLLSRIVAVERRHDADRWSTGPASDDDAIIRSVHDNIRGLESAKYYRIVRGGLDEDATAYVDRPHQWNGISAKGIPRSLRGADYIMPFNQDKWSNDLEITVEIARGSTLFIFMDDREKDPSWLTEQFAKTKLRIGLDEGVWPDPYLTGIDRGPGKSINQTFSVWRRDMERDESIRLGSLAGGRNDRAMYGIAAIARP